MACEKWSGVTAESLAELNRRQQPSSPTFDVSLLDGDTPVPSPPESVYGGPTRVGSPCPDVQSDKLEKDFEKFDVALEKQSPAEELVDGGRQAWLSVLGTAFVLFSTFGLSNCE